MQIFSFHCMVQNNSFLMIKSTFQSLIICPGKGKVKETTVLEDTFIYRFLYVFE